MKTLSTLFTVVLIITGSIVVNAQDSVKNVASSTLKKGIYRTFEEFKNNAPSIALTQNISTVYRKTGGVVKGEETTFYGLETHKYTAKKVGRIYGFCDGKNIFINEYRPKLKSNTLFMRVRLIGDYCIFEYKSRDGAFVLLPRNKAVNMITGRLKIVSKKQLIVLNQQLKVANKHTRIAQAISVAGK